MPEGTVQPPPDFLRRDADEDKPDIARAELFLENHRVTGIIEQSGPPRRLVDILNTIEGPIIVVRDATVERFAGNGEEAHHFELLHVRREMVMLAIPHSTSTPAPGRIDAVEKRRTAATLALPGLEVTGHVHLPPQADPEAVRLLGRRDFLPITEAEVTQIAFGLRRWRQPLVVVNLGWALFYAPAPR